VTFVSRPITATILLVTVAILAFGIYRSLQMKRRKIASDQQHKGATPLAAGATRRSDAE
jgi:hypothetical protein